MLFSHEKGTNIPVYTFVNFNTSLHINTIQQHQHTKTCNPDTPTSDKGHTPIDTMDNANTIAKNTNRATLTQKESKTAVIDAAKPKMQKHQSKL